jgi:hypothetical protein
MSYFCNSKFQKTKIISLKIDDSIFGETEDILSRIKKPSYKYINEAIEYYNHYQRRLFLEKQLKNESYLVNVESLNILHEFEITDHVSKTI